MLCHKFITEQDAHTHDCGSVMEFRKPGVDAYGEDPRGIELQGEEVIDEDERSL